MGREEAMHRGLERWQLTSLVGEAILAMSTASALFNHTEK